MKGIMKITYILAAAAMVSILGSCAKWTKPESISIPETVGQSEEYLAAIRAYKQTDHKIVVLGMDAISGPVSTRNYHPMSMPDSADYIYIKNIVGGLNESLIPEISEVYAKKGTKVLADVDYVAIENAWKAQEDAKAEGEPAGTEEEYKAFVTEQTIAQLECVTRYGCAGAMASYTGSYSSKYWPTAGRTAYVEAIIDWWKTNGSGKDLIARGNLVNIGSGVERHEEFFKLCKYYIYRIGSVTAPSTIDINILGTVAYVDRFIFEATLPTSIDPTQYGMSPAQAAAWIAEPSAEGANYTKEGLSIENAEDDYFTLGNNYPNVRRAISVLNPAPVEEETPAEPAE